MRPFLWLRRFFGKWRRWEAGNCALFSGWCANRDLDMSVALFWNRVENPQEGRLRWHDGIELYWNWLPEVWWVPAYEPSYGIGNAIRADRWTGRKRALGGFRWDFGAHRFRSSVRP